MACNIIIAPVTETRTIDVSSRQAKVETITANGSSQQTSIVAPTDTNLKFYVQIFAGGASVWVKVGENPVATVGGSSILLGQDERWDAAIMQGHKVAVIAA